MNHALEPYFCEDYSASTTSRCRGREPRLPRSRSVRLTYHDGGSSLIYQSYRNLEKGE